MRFDLASIGAILLALSVVPAHSEELTDTAAGSKVRNVVTIGKSQVPLPKGEWEVLATNTWRRGSLGKMGQAFLLQDSHESGFVGIQIRANIEVSNCVGWTRPDQICDRKDTLHNSSDRNYNPKDASCWNLNHYIVSPYRETKSKYWKKVYQAMKDRGIAKTTYIVNTYFRSSRCNFLILRYYSNPEHFDFPIDLKAWVGSAWHRDQIHWDSRRVSFAEAAKKVGETLSEAVESGFERKLDNWSSDIALEFE